MKNIPPYLLIICIFGLSQFTGCASVPEQQSESAEIVSKETPFEVEPLDINSDIQFEDIPEDGGIVAAEDLIIIDRSSELNSEAADPGITESSVEIVETESIEPVPTGDLWDRLRSGFVLETDRPTNDAIQKFERWYSKHPKFFERLADRAYWLLPYILDEVEKRRMPAEVALLPAVESAFRHDATSHSNAVGLWQMISATGRRFGLRNDWWMDGRRDMTHSTRAALDYLEYLSREFNGDWILAMAAYNAGEGNIRKQIRRNQAKNKATDYWSLDLHKETEEYIPKLFAIRNIISNPAKYNITIQLIPNYQTLQVVDARVQTDLTVAASLIPISATKLHAFNLGYRRGVTPPTGPHNIVVPSEYADALTSKLNKLTVSQRMRWSRHQVRKGEYLGRIARKHGVSVESIILANQLGSNMIQPGQELRILISTGHVQYAKATTNNIKIENGDKIYTIKLGDTLWKISRNVGASLSKLLRWNGLTKNTLLHPGQQLIIGRSS